MSELQTIWECEECGHATRIRNLVPESRLEAAEAKLREAMEYAEHASWRCAHPPHYYLAGGPPENGDCPCGLLSFEKRVAALLDQDSGEARVCPECGEPDEGNDAHDGECSQTFPYLTPAELATYEKLRPCFVELFRREDSGLSEGSGRSFPGKGGGLKGEHPASATDPLAESDPETRKEGDADGPQPDGDTTDATPPPVAQKVIEAEVTFDESYTKPQDEAAGGERCTCDPALERDLDCPIHGDGLSEGESVSTEAVAPPDPRPLAESDRCPDCGSTDRANRLRLLGRTGRPCDNPWHSCPTCGSDDPKRHILWSEAGMIRDPHAADRCPGKFHTPEVERDGD